jgi:hypothetical protein
MIETSSIQKSIIRPIARNQVKVRALPSFWHLVFILAPNLALTTRQRGNFHYATDGGEQELRSNRHCTIPEFVWHRPFLFMAQRSRA